MCIVDVYKYKFILYRFCVCDESNSIEQCYHLHQPSNNHKRRQQQRAKVPNVIFHRFNAFWLLPFTQTIRTDSVKKVKWNANEELS